MPAFLLLILLSAVPLQEEPLYRERAEKFVVQLDSENEKIAEQAKRELGHFSTSLIPMILEIASPDRHPRAAERLKNILPPDPWRRILKRPISHAVSDLESILTGKDYRRDGAIKAAISGLTCLPAAEARAILEHLAADADLAVRDFAETARLFIDARPGGAYAKQLGSPIYCHRAADLVILTGETTAIPKAVEIFCRLEEPESRAAARVLEAFGAGDGVVQVAAVLKGRSGYSAEAIRILGRTGGDKAGQALREALAEADPKFPASGEIARQLRILYGAGADADIRNFRARGKPVYRKNIGSHGLLTLEDAKAALAAIRGDAKPFAALSLKQLLRTAHPELREDVLAWINDPAVRVEQLKNLLPLLGAVGGKGDAELLLRHLEQGPAGDGAAEGLALIGDPEHAPKVWNAYLKSRAIFLNSSMVSFPPGALEDELVAEFAKSGFPNARAYQLARVHPTPKIRKALFDRMMITEQGTYTMWDAPLILSEARTDEEKEWVEKLRALNHMNRMYGDFLALRGGSAEAADRLAETWANNDAWGSFRNPVHYWNWKACEEKGQIWKDAVEKAWKKKPEWQEGRLELARWGHKPALETLRADLQARLYPYRDHALRALARNGDAPALEWFLEWVMKVSGIPDPDEDLLVAMAEDEAFRVRLRVFARCGLEGQNWALEVLAGRTDPASAPLFRMGALRGSTECLRALVRLKDPEAFALAIRGLRSWHADGRIAAIRVLGEMGNKAAVPALLECLDDMEENSHPRRGRGTHGFTQEGAPVRVAGAAIAALEKLTGVKSDKTVVADRRDFWREWRAKNRATWK